MLSTCYVDLLVSSSNIDMISSMDHSDRLTRSTLHACASSDKSVCMVSVLAVVILIQPHVLFQQMKPVYMTSHYGMYIHIYIVL